MVDQIARLPGARKREVGIEESWAHKVPVVREVGGIVKDLPYQPDDGG